MSAISEIVLSKAKQTGRGYSVLLVVSERLYDDFKAEMDKYHHEPGFFELAKLKLSGQSGPHFNVCTVVNPSEVEDKRAFNEFKMVPAHLNGRPAIFEVVEI